MFYEVTIEPCSSGFGEYQCLPINGDGWGCDTELLRAIEGDNGEVFLLGRDELPAGCEDIRGRIHNEPARVYAYSPDQRYLTEADRRWWYFGIVEREEVTRG